MNSSNPWVVAPKNEDAEPWGNLKGAGVFDSLADAAGPIFGTARDAAGVGFDLAGSGVEFIGVAMNPLGALASAGVGWLVEHVEFLHEPLDWLAGDPTVITAQAHTWHRVSTELAVVAGDYEAEMAGLRGWDGVAMQSYRGAAAPYAAALRAGSVHAAEVSETISNAGVAVGTTRALIRDWIAELVSDLITRAVAALAASPATLGASLAAFVASAVASASALASKISVRVARLLEMLGRMADKLRTMTVRMNRLGEAAARAAGSIGRTPVRVPLTRPDGGLVKTAYDNHQWTLKTVVEAGKQDANDRQERRQWAVKPAT